MNAEPSPLDLLLYLNSLGSLVPLRLFTHPKEVLPALGSFDGDWKPYNPHKPGYQRWGLSLTSLDGGFSGVPDLYSLKEYNMDHLTGYREDDFTKPTAAYHACPGLTKVLDEFNPLCRSHFLKLGRGGFFPPHRDNALVAPECFRLFCSLNYTADSFSFVLDGRQVYFEPGVFYILNTTLAHSLVSFNDFSYFIVLNVALKREMVEKVNLWLSVN